MEASSPLGFIEQILLVIFMLMLFVGIAGGNPSMVIKPVFDIVGTILSLLCSLLLTVFRVLITLLTSGLRALVAMLTNSRNINR